MVQIVYLPGLLGVPKFKAIDPNTHLSSLDSGVYCLQQAQYAIDVPSDIASSTYTYMYIKSLYAEILMPIDLNSAVWYSRYNYNSWFKHG